MPNGYPEAPYAWTPPDLSGYELAYPEKVQAAAMGQTYLNWLDSYLTLMHQSEDDPLKDPTKEGTAAYNLRMQAKDLVNAGVFGTGGEIELPFIQEFYQAVQGYQEMYPGEVAPAELTPEETAYLESQTAYNQARVDAILNDIATTGQITEAQQGQLDLSIRELEFAMTQAGIGTQQDWAELELAKQQLAQQQAQWQQEFGLERERFGLEQQQMGLDWGKYLAELQASPADFIQRWYAERLPFGADMPGWITEAGWNWTQEAGWQPPAQVTEPAEAIVEGEVAPPTAPVTPTAPGVPAVTPPGAPAAGITIPEGMTQQQALGMWTPQELKTGVLTPGKEDPVYEFLSENVGQLTAEEIEWWLRDMSLEGVYDELNAEANRRFPGGFIGAGNMREYARRLRDTQRMGEIAERGMYPEAFAAADAAAKAAGLTEPTEMMIRTELSKYAWVSGLLHQQAVEQAASVPYEQWRQTTRINEWETETDIRRRYESLLAEATQEGLTTVEPAIDPTVTWELGLPAIERAKEAAWQQVGAALAPVAPQVAAPAVTPPPVVAPQPVAQPVAPPQPPYVQAWQQAYPGAPPPAPAPAVTSWQPTPAQQAAIAPWKGATW